MSNVYIAMKEKLYFRLKQIKREEYNWLEDNVICDCKTLLDQNIRLDSLDVSNIQQEHTIIDNTFITEHEVIDEILRPFIESNHIPDAKYRFTARVDMITENTIWELKCTSQISIEHLLQVVIYAWLWYSINPNSKKIFKILNIKTGEIFELQTTSGELTYIITTLLEGKYGTQKTLSDIDFQNCFT
jgi:hypothetical protein